MQQTLLPDQRSGAKNSVGPIYMSDPFVILPGWSMSITASSAMTRFTSSPAVAWVWIPCVLAALAYPHLLATFHYQFNSADGSRVLALPAMILAFGVSGLGLLGAFASGRNGLQGPRVRIARRIAHLVVAVPPLFVFMGVLLFLMRVEGKDVAVWTAVWLAVAAATLMRQFVDPGGSRAADVGPQSSRRRNAALRVAHGATAVAILLVFLAPHLGNHLLALLGDDVHLRVMHMLRDVYRNGLIEPLLIGIIALQVISGLILWRSKVRACTDFLGTLQTASGAYLAAFLLAHVNSVFTLARYFGTDTTWAWATSAPNGLTADAWDVRLIPHYALGIFMLLAHLCCALRVVMVAHGVPVARANCRTWCLLGLGTVLTAAISAAMLGWRIT